ncbi:MAG: hypothetical protein PVH17_07940 [Anaerolineae bacterium]|jgi:hypothetical protein
MLCGTNKGRGYLGLLLHGEPRGRASREFYSEIPATTRSIRLTTSPACDVVAIVNGITSSRSDSAVSYSGLN